MTRSDVLWLVGIVIAGGGLFAALCVERLRGVPLHLTRQFLLAIAAYLLHGAVGIAILIYAYPGLSHTAGAAGGAVIALFGWIGLGLHVLFRLLPREFWPSERPKPHWMQRFGLFDIACLCALAGGSAVATGLI